MNAPDLIFRSEQAKARANAVLVERLEEIAGAHEWATRKYRQRIASDYSGGSAEKLEALLSCPLLDVALDGIEAVFPGRPEHANTGRLVGARNEKAQ